MTELPNFRIFAPIWKLTGEGQGCHWEGKEVDAEVLTLHLESGKMRVRYILADGKLKCIDVPMDIFDRHYEVVKK